jgi:catechol 2,3-dioxygenase-like lactoylglutathione lyase family enzyme
MPTLTLTTVTLSSPHPLALAGFYGRLLGREVTVNEDEPDWVVLRDQGGAVSLACQLEQPYDRPVWPARPGAAQMQAHLEIRVDDLAAAVGHAVACGATVAEHQPQEDVRVCLDPDGHPFCLWVEA